MSGIRFCSLLWVPFLLAVVAGCGDDDGKDSGCGDVAVADPGPAPADTLEASDGTPELPGADTAVPDAAADPGAGGDPGSPVAANCAECHVGMAGKLAGSKHAILVDGCVTCHANGLEHQVDPATVRAKLDFSIELCGQCHYAQQETYLKDDGKKAGHFGGSVKTSKYDEIPHYQHLMGGHGFTKEYNEDRAHRYMLKDHIDIQRKQNTVCLQCKSTPVAYFWNEPRRGQPVVSKDMPWDAVVQKIRDEWGATIDYGAGCDHCHDPHATAFRLVRKAQVAAILERGTDPYTEALNKVPKSVTELEALMNERGENGELTPAAKRLAGTLTCAQCHVEYACGGGIDKEKGILRDDFPWRKLADLEEYYRTKYDLIQDWKHAITGLPGIKAQHPETEFYWNSPHHLAGNACTDCHMAEENGQRSHWLTSPLKQPAVTCGRCHGATDAKVTAVLGSQDATWATAQDVETNLDEILLFIEAEATTPTLPPEVVTEAGDHFMRGLLWWEFTMVSENSTGWHNQAEAAANLAFALDEALAARALLGL